MIRTLNPPNGDRRILLRLIKHIVVSDNGCWEWSGGKSTDGYGQTFVHVKDKAKTVRAHRLFYEIFCGNIPNGLVIDHVCRNIICVNPEHLEAVTSKENTNRGINHNRIKTHCPIGHEYTDDNTLHQKKSNGYISRKCRRCNIEKSKARRLRIKLYGYNK